MTTNIIERSFKPIVNDDLKQLYKGSVEVIQQYFFHGNGKKWLSLYDIKNPIAVALCQGAAMHYYDKVTGVNDFDVWFFYPFNQKHLPYHARWNWDFVNPKFGRHPQIQGYRGRKVDVFVRSIRNYSKNNPVETIHKFLQYEDTQTANRLSQKAVVLLTPNFLGQVVWYKGII